VAQVSCLGVAVLDALSGPLERYPTPRVDTQVVTERLVIAPGGGAANTASALARMGLSAALFSKIGEDAAGAFLLRQLADCGVDTTGVCVSQHDATPFTFVGVHPGGDRTFIHTPGANRTLSLTDLDTDALLASAWLVYQDFWVLPGIDGESGAALLADARRRGVVTLLDECWGLGPDREAWELMLPHCDYALPSLDDMQAIYPGASAEEVADVLLARGARAAVIKMGARGCLVATPSMRARVPALPASVVDATGAGDCWDAGFVAGLIEGRDVVAAARIGNACAAFCLEAMGAAVNIPPYADVARRAGLLAEEG
jgi:sugar/nucleoside kinase (ribokinase family)